MPYETPTRYSGHPATDSSHAEGAPTSQPFTNSPPRNTLAMFPMTNRRAIWIDAFPIPPACPGHRLGDMYRLGTGVIQDKVYVYAHMWANLAGSNGSKKGRELRDFVAERMTPAQITEAQRLARECVVVSDSWWKFDLGVAPSPNGHSIMRRGQGKARLVRDRGSASHRRGAW